MTGVSILLTTSQKRPEFYLFDAKGRRPLHFDRGKYQANDERRQEWRNGENTRRSKTHERSGRGVVAPGPVSGPGPEGGTADFFLLRASRMPTPDKTRAAEISSA